MRTTTIFLLLLVTAPSALAQLRVAVSVLDADSGSAIPARLYLTSADGKPYYFKSSSDDGTAVRYEKQNWINKASVEYHTTVSAHPAFANVPPGSYLLVVERGKTYFPHRQTIDVGDSDVTVPPIRLRRWSDPAARRWYSGDTHIHRTIDELRNVILVEDLNVVFPLTNWVTLSDTPPSAGNKNLDIELPTGLVRVDDDHVIWPRSTEYEIFTVAKQRHTLGALFVLGHKDPLQLTVPPWKPVVEAARAADPDVLFDMDKLAWPFAMTLPVIAPDSTYELANNHMWRTEFAFREWYTTTPPFIAPPHGDTEGGEREWIDFTLGMYYALLNCGFRMPPAAGTANGVHPVPAGFGRVYVHLPDGFEFQAWRRGLQQGRSFVTTGPMLFATADGEHAGHTFQFDDDSAVDIPIQVELISEQPVTFGEILINGVPEHLLRSRSQRTESGAYRVVIETTIRPRRSGWFAIRFFEDREGGDRVRFAHTAPWYVEVGDQPVMPTYAERQYLIRRMTDEIQRSRGIVSAEGLAEYEQALEYYRSLPIVEETIPDVAGARPLDDQNRQRWLENMVVDHRFDPAEVRAATGMTIAASEIAHAQIQSRVKPSEHAPELRVLPYPGGRHPRRGFLDGAIDPQRETKISVFPPWEEGGYAVVDVPEAIFSNLGLTYLAHTHVPTIWTNKSVQLEQLEWTETDDGLQFERKLPNGIAFGSGVTTESGAVAMEMWLHNGTDQKLTGMRSQVCVMLKGLVGFNRQRRRSAVVEGPFIAIKADQGDRWIITAWQPNNRAWDNPPVPCIHSDPVFPDCDPGQTVRVRGGLWFYEGQDIAGEIGRLAQKFAPQ